MMMPEGGDVKIAYNPEAKDGFRLGLMSDFGTALIYFATFIYGRMHIE